MQNPLSVRNRTLFLRPSDRNPNNYDHKISQILQVQINNNIGFVIVIILYPNKGRCELCLLGTVRPLFRTGVSLLSRERFLYI